VADHCGNYIWLNQSVTVQDITPPVFSQLPPNVTVPCNQIPAIVPPVATDDCSNVTIAFQTYNTSVPNACQNYTIIRKWTATDACGNIASVQQVITVQQTQPPAFNQPLPQNVTLDCTQNFTAPTLTASDICGAAPVSLAVLQIQDTPCIKIHKYTWTATNNCGYTVSHSIFVTITDIVKPTFTLPSGFQPVISANCNDTLVPPSLCCNDNCPGSKLVYNETRTNSPDCPSRYTLNRLWTCTDQCGNVVTQTQTVNINDVFPPAFNNLPADVYEECHDTSVAPVLTASSTCTGATVSMTNVTIPGGCPANYTIIRRYVATDNCGQKVTFNQTVHVADTIPPWTNETAPLCFYSETSLDYLIIRNLTVPNVFFPAGDACSSVRIRFDSCSSDQDNIMGSGCFFNASADELYVSPNVSQSRPEGRLYTVRATVIDACGHETPTSRQIFVPFNRTSITIRNLPFNPEECVPIRTPCPRGCECQTVDHYCNEGASDATLSFQGAQKNEAAGTTTFTYKLNIGSTGRPNRVLIGVDLTHYEVVSFSPSTNVTFGPQIGSYVQGIAWTGSSADTFSFTLQGKIESSSLISNVPYQLGGYMSRQDGEPSACSLVFNITGPGRQISASYDSSSSNDVAGRVLISGFRFGSDLSSSIPVNDIAVALIDKASGAVLRVTLTDRLGAYAFHDIASSSSVALKLLPEAAWRPSLRSSGNFLRAHKYDILGHDNVYGDAHSLGDATFKLLLDETETPIYNRALAPNSFEGDSKPLSYWRYTVRRLGEPDAQYGGSLSAIESAADALIGCAASIHSSDALEANLRAAALNLAVGRGFFEPYKAVQSWYFAEAAHVFCDKVSSSADRALALRAVTLINDASDIDRVY